MRGRLASYRFRRRLYWTCGAVMVLSGIVVGAILVGNTGRKNVAPLIDKPAQVYTEPPAMSLSEADRLRLYQASTKFVKTAVARKRLDSAWELLGPEMQAGQTRSSWDTGNNNVIPFNANGIQRFDVLYSFEGDVAIDLSLISGRGKSWAGKTFTIEWRRYPQRGNRWLVAAWVPKGIGGGGTLSPTRQAGPPLPPVRAKLSAKYLLVPFVFIMVALATIVAVAGRSAIQTRRAARRYADALGYNSTSNPS
jgi:hypothetical protein